jgi:hypothetical protein
LNGSRLGKEFSANVFHAWFNEGNPPQQQVSNQSQQRQSNSSTQPQTRERTNVPAKTPVNTNQNTSQPANSFDTSIIGELSGIFDLQPQGENYEEIAFARRMRKKKKKRKI